LPLLGFFSFIHLNFEHRITSTCKKLQREFFPGKKIFLAGGFGK